MTDEAQPSSTEPNAPVVAQPGESSASSAAVGATPVVSQEQPTMPATSVSSAASALPASQQPAETLTTTAPDVSADPNATAPSAHTHESLLRRIHDVLTAKFAGLDHELNHLLAEARKIL